jgi:hypothetical protein
MPVRGTTLEKSNSVWEVRVFAGRDPVTERPLCPAGERGELPG